MNQETHIIVDFVVFSALAFKLLPSALTADLTLAHAHREEAQWGKSSAAPTGVFCLLFKALKMRLNLRAITRGNR